MLLMVVSITLDAAGGVEETQRYEAGCEAKQDDYNEQADSNNVAHRADRSRVPVAVGLRCEPIKSALRLVILFPPSGVLQCYRARQRVPILDVRYERS